MTLLTIYGITFMLLFLVTDITCFLVLWRWSKRLFEDMYSVSFLPGVSAAVDLKLSGGDPEMINVDELPDGSRVRIRKVLHDSRRCLTFARTYKQVTNAMLFAGFFFQALDIALWLLL